MFGTLFSNLQADNTNEPEITRRRFSRRRCDQCVSVINGQPYPVEDWSMGGLMLNGDSRIFGVDETLDVTLKFKLQDQIIDVDHKARVIRKTADKIALEFAPLSRDIRSNLQNVVDDYVTSHFANGGRA